jgi:transporter family-2 protein
LWASATQNLVGALAMLRMIAALRPTAPSAGQIASAPLWSWVGGLMGMVYVFSVLVAALQLGAARAMTAAVVGQPLCLMLLNHFGVLPDRRPISLVTIAGVIPLIGGAALTLRRD